MKKTAYALFAAVLMILSSTGSAAVFSTKDITEEKKEDRSKTEENRKKVIKATREVREISGDSEGAAGSEGFEGSSGKKGFLGVKVSRKKEILFIVDTSGSMADRTPEGGTRIEVLKGQLKSVVENAYDDEDDEGATPGHYTIIEFNSSVSRFPDKGKRQFRQHTDVLFRRFVDRMQANGGTCMLMAWVAAAKSIKREKARYDVIYFLTDGDPTDCDESVLLDYIDSNIPKETVIHCFSIGKPSGLMQNIAKLRKGVYKFIR